MDKNLRICLICYKKPCDCDGFMFKIMTKKDIKSLIKFIIFIIISLSLFVIWQPL